MLEITPEQLDLTRWIRRGDLISWSHATAEPLPLTHALMAQRHAIGAARILLGTMFSKNVRPEHADVFEFTGFGVVGSSRDFFKAGVMNIVPSHLSEIPSLFASGALRPDVVLVQLAERGGRLSLGSVNMYVSAALRHARVVIAEINDRAPWTHASAPVDASRIDVAIRTSRPLIQMPARPPAELDRAIAARVIGLVPDGAVLQVGIGGVPNAVLAGLRDHRDLGIHSGVIGDDVLSELIETGVVTNASKPFDAGVTITGGLFGTDKLYGYADGNAALRVEAVEYTHDPARTSRFQAFVTLNSAIEVDLTGQVNGETAGRDYIGTIGGQTDFIRGALASPKGRSIIALPSTVDRSGASRVVAQLGAGVTTTARADADAFVTEHGIAELRGKSIRQRVKAMLAIADPAHRDALERQAREVVAGYA